MAGTSADKLALLQATKADLKAALTEKGQTPGDVFADYPDMVRAIETGGEDLSEELTAQDSLIAQIMTALDGKAAASVIDTCTVTVTWNNFRANNNAVGCVAATYQDGKFGYYAVKAPPTSPVLLDHVICGSLVVATGRDILVVSVGGGVARIDASLVPSQLQSSDGIQESFAFIAPQTAGASGTITLNED